MAPNIKEKKMKVILNKCYGGYTLSHDAKMELLKVKHTGAYPYVCSSNYDGKTITLLDMPYNSENATYGLDIVYMEGPIEETPCVMHEDDFMQEAKTANDIFSSTERDDPDLVAVVERLGERASGSCSKLVVVDIDDDIQDYEISEYDGFETLHEKHRKW
jgi:hypothetical protein